MARVGAQQCQVNERTGPTVTPLFRTQFTRSSHCRSFIPQNRGGVKDCNRSVGKEKAHVLSVILDLGLSGEG